MKEHVHSVRTFCQINKKYFASGSFDHTIKIWDIDSWECVQTLNGHELNIICLNCECCTDNNVLKNKKWN